MRLVRKLLPLAVVLALAGTLKLVLAGHVLLNITASVPRGLYWIAPARPPLRGELVVLTIPEQSRSLLHDRGYVPRSIKLLAKPVAAIPGDHVCIRNTLLFINDQLAGTIRTRDSAGRPMPVDALCRPLERDEVFLATGHDDSFDSRHFGPVRLDNLRGLLMPIVTTH